MRRRQHLGSPLQGGEPRCRDSPSLIKLDLRTVGRGTRPAPDGKMPASLGQPFVAKTESLRRSEFGDGPRSETGSRSRRESERARGERERKERKGPGSGGRGYQTVERKHAHTGEEGNKAAVAWP